MSKVCCICKRDIDADTAPILAMSGYGNPKQLCPECDGHIVTLTESLDATEIARSIEALGESLTKSDTDDVQVIAIVTDMLEDAKEKMDAIENGSYTPEENEEDSEDEFEITEDLMETEEDRILDEEEARVSKKIDTITSWIAGAFFIATVVFLIIKSFF
ncbi:MAG: hypothetical protein E7617_05555 [Ruminococcaceae bacterium]|nr:hypothetical protein [Oscillospiraceae bacterium]